MTTDSVEDMGQLGSMTRRNAVEQKKVKGSVRRQQELIVSCLLLDSYGWQAFMLGKQSIEGVRKAKQIFEFPMIFSLLSYTTQFLYTWCDNF